MCAIRGPQVVVDFGILETFLSYPVITLGVYMTIMVRMGVCVSCLFLRDCKK